MCWVWCWLDIDIALDRIARSRPVVVGPNVLFAWSGNPGGARGEREILDSRHCPLIMCHSQWYAELIRRHVGADNGARIAQWPYPVSPIPDVPVRAEYDVLVFDKMAGARRDLEDALGARFPTTMVIRYGAFERFTLYEIARRSRCCVYLCEDESGGLATSEIMMAGCPVVGIERGAPFAADPIGVRIARLDIELIESAVRACHRLDRRDVRSYALALFDAVAIAEAVVRELDRARRADTGERT
jgi:hypothetical protein